MARSDMGYTPGREGGTASLTYLRSKARRRANAEWRREIISRSGGTRSFRVPSEGGIPRIPEELRKAPKDLASCFFQLASGHAMIPPFLREKFGWIEYDLCWWCGSSRQSREHLFKERITGRKR